MKNEGLNGVKATSDKEQKNITDCWQKEEKITD